MKNDIINPLVTNKIDIITTLKLILLTNYLLTNKIDITILEK